MSDSEPSAATLLYSVIPTSNAMARQGPSSAFDFTFSFALAYSLLFSLNLWFLKQPLHIIHSLS